MKKLPVRLNYEFNLLNHVEAAATQMAAAAAAAQTMHEGDDNTP